MSEFWSLLLVLTLNMWTLTTADDDISCVLAEICILPCSFQPGTDPVVHWMKVEAGDIYVHSYYKAGDQFAHQSERFRGRTSLFKEQISRGNASLRMTGLQLQDQGRYKCYASTISGSTKESFINLRADAPVRNVDMEQEENSFTCRSEGIYPEPELTWSTSPPSNVTLQGEPTVKKTEQQLYEISSNLTLSDTDTDLICTVSTRSGSRRVMWHRPTPVHVSHGETTTLHCTAPNIKPPTHLVWKFNHSQIIVNRTEVHGPHEVSEQWRQQVEDVSASGSLTLHHLSSHHQGTFTCELSDEEETHLINSYVTIETETVSDSVIVIIVLTVLTSAVGVAAGFYFKRRKIKCNKQKKKQTQSPSPKSLKLRVSVLRLKGNVSVFEAKPATSTRHPFKMSRQERFSSFICCFCHFLEEMLVSVHPMKRMMRTRDKKEMKPELEKDKQISQDEEDEDVEDEDFNLEIRADSR